MDEAKPEQLYSAVQLYCEAINSLLTDKSLSIEQKEKKEEWTNQAIETLEVAVQKGFSVKSIGEDEKLAVLREVPRFQTLVNENADSKNDQEN